MFGLFMPKIQHVELVMDNGKYCIKYHPKGVINRQKVVTFDDMYHANIKLEKLYKRRTWDCIVNNKTLENVNEKIQRQCNYFFFNKCCENVK